MNTSAAVALAGLTALSLSACKVGPFSFGENAKAPTGQVVATVGDREITARQLSAEMTGAAAPDPKARHEAEMATLHNIVGRTVLAKAAVEQGVDKTPEFVVAKQRLVDGLLVQSLQNKLTNAVPKPSAEEADKFVAEHPDIFGQRKIFMIDFIRMARPTDPAIVKALQPLKTLEQVEAQLKTEKIQYQRSTGNLDAVGADPRMIDAVVKLPAGEVFVIPNGNTLLVNQVRETKIVPFTGPQATDYARKLLARQRTQESVNRQFGAIINKAAPTVKFSKAYAQPAPAAGTAATAPKPAAAGN